MVRVATRVVFASLLAANVAWIALDSVRPSAPSGWRMASGKDAPDKHGDKDKTG